MMTLIGKIYNVHEYVDSNDIGYVTAVIGVERTSGVIDSIHIKAKTDDGVIQMMDGDYAKVTGTLRSYKQENSVVHSRVEMFVRHYDVLTEEEYEQVKGTNEFIQVVEVFRKAPKTRTTPNNTLLFDCALMTRRKSGVTDIIPAIVWGSGATAFSKTVNVGDKIKVYGRLQSRTYNKTLDNGETVVCETYEVSLAKWEVPVEE